MCDANAGLFSGLWDGLLALISLVADIFLDIDVFNDCTDSGLYTVGFVLGIMLFGWSFALLRNLWWIVLPVSFIIWVGSLFLGSLTGLIVLAVLVGGGYYYTKHA